MGKGVPEKPVVCRAWCECLYYKQLSCLTLWKSLANKQDLPGAMRIDEVRIKMASVISTRPACAVFPTSLISKDCVSTLTPAMDWLYDVLSGTQPEQSHSGSQASQAPTDALAEKLTSWIDRASKDTSPDEFLKAFEDINLPSWDHYTHIRIAYTILKIYGRQKGGCFLTRLSAEELRSISRQKHDIRRFGEIYQDQSPDDWQNLPCHHDLFLDSNRPLWYARYAGGRAS